MADGTSMSEGLTPAPAKPALATEGLKGKPSAEVPGQVKAVKDYAGKEINPEAAQQVAQAAEKPLGEVPQDIPGAMETLAGKQPVPESPQILPPIPETPAPILTPAEVQPAAPALEQPVPAGEALPPQPPTGESPAPVEQPKEGTTPPLPMEDETQAAENETELTEEQFVKQEIDQDEQERQEKLQKGKQLQDKSLQEILDAYDWDKVYTSGSRVGQKRTLEDVVLDIEEDERRASESGSPDYKPRKLTPEEKLERDRIKKLHIDWNMYQGDLQIKKTDQKEAEIAAELKKIENDNSDQAKQRKQELLGKQQELKDQKMATYKMLAKAHQKERGEYARSIDNFSAWLARNAGDKRIREHFKEWRGYRDLYKARAKDIWKVAGAKNVFQYGLKRMLGQLTGDQKEEIQKLQGQMKILGELAAKERNAWVGKNIFRLILLWALVIGPAALTILPAVVSAKLLQVGGKAQ